jgi:hypothetical protein
MTAKVEGIGPSPIDVGGPDREEIRNELDRTCRAFHGLLDAADEFGLDSPSDGTRWTNRQLLFHMMFGYMVVRALLPLVNVVNRLPASVGRAFAAVLNVATGPFNSINYWGSVVGSHLYRDQRMGPKFDAVIAALERRLARESEADMNCTMAYPTRWDPFFKDAMTLTDVYRYPTQHFEFHRRQLTLKASPRMQTDESPSSPRR